MSIGENIRKFREAKGLTQQQLADKLNMARPTLTQFERGSRIPNMSTGDAIARELGCTIIELLGHSPPQQQSQQPGAE
jgi:transcriptional regulator with XRE-family HTH domain